MRARGIWAKGCVTVTQRPMRGPTALFARPASAPWPAPARPAGSMVELLRVVGPLSCTFSASRAQQFGVALQPVRALEGEVRRVCPPPWRPGNVPGATRPPGPGRGSPGDAGLLVESPRRSLWASPAVGPCGPLSFPAVVLRVGRRRWPASCRSTPRRRPYSTGSAAGPRPARRPARRRG